MVTRYVALTGQEQKTHVGQTGQRFAAEIRPAADPFTLAGATRMEFVFKSPSGVETAKTATEVGAPSGTTEIHQDEFGNDVSFNIQLEHTIDDANLFDEAGVWTFRVEVDGAGSEKHIGAATEFTVYAKGA